MARQPINIGATANDGSGDTPRAAGQKINNAFSEIYDLFSTDGITLDQPPAPVALSGSYDDLTGVPAIPTSPADIGAATAAQGDAADSAVQTVAGEGGPTISATALRTALNVEDGATADQTGAELVTAIDAQLGQTDWKQAATGGTGNSWGDPVDADIVPNVNNTFDLGSDAARFATGHVEQMFIAGVQSLAYTAADQMTLGTAFQTVAGVSGPSVSAVALRTAINVEDGATADQTGAELVSAIDTELGQTDWKQAATGGTGDAWGDPVDADIIPGTNNTFDLGSDAARFAQANVQQMFIGGVESLAFTAANQTTLGTAIQPADIGTAAANDTGDFATAAQGLTADSAVQTVAGETGPTVGAAALRTALNVEDGATADQTDAEIETAYNAQVPAASQAEAEAGTVTAVRRFSPLRVAQAIAALAGGDTEQANLLEAKAVPVDGDIGVIYDSEDATPFKGKQLTFGNLWSWILGRFIAGGNLGTVTADITLAQSNGSFQRLINGGAFALSPPSGNGSISLQVTNNASAGAITTTAFTLVDGDALDAVDANNFMLFITKNNGFSTLTVRALP